MVDLFSNLKFLIANIGLEIVVAKCVTFGYFISRYSNYTDPFMYPRAAHNLEFHACVNIWVSVYTRENILHSFFSPRIRPKFSACVCFLYSSIWGKVEGRERVLV